MARLKLVQISFSFHPRDVFFLLSFLFSLSTAPPPFSLVALFFLTRCYALSTPQFPPKAWPLFIASYNHCFLLFFLFFSFFFFALHSKPNSTNTSFFLFSLSFTSVLSFKTNLGRFHTNSARLLARPYVTQPASLPFLLSLSPSPSSFWFPSTSLSSSSSSSSSS